MATSSKFQQKFNNIKFSVPLTWWSFEREENCCTWQWPMAYVRLPKKQRGSMKQ